MEYNELVERFEMGEEFQLYYKGVSYWISQNEEGYYLTREEDGFTQSFESADQLFELGKIDNITILEAWPNIEV
ncbi:hypothetical protein OIN60_18775 [Paenibacillus sp. P96]|uniref:Phage protein n=1 Tax=Paenibacillus zeirhizosphaerae TaxID=2987519 RepID=A0ABT9FVM2_9BACL|nr:hypothetical protein [Paenibacillus sp. P96]MDP4098778.1 hypothetical protein [Paenibacillus sp. P96]